MRYEQYLLTDVLNKNHFGFNPIMDKFIEESNWEELYKHAHDYSLFVLMKYDNYEERYEGESDEIASFTGEEFWRRVNIPYLHYPTNEFGYIKKRTYYFIHVYRQEFGDYIDPVYLDKEFQNDIELKLAIMRSSGLVDRSAYDFYYINNSDNYIELDPEDFVDYVMDKFCKYQEDTYEYSNLYKSLLLSEYNHEFVAYNIEKRDYNQLQLLINQYDRLFKKYYEEGVIYIANKQ